MRGQLSVQDVQLVSACTGGVWSLGSQEEQTETVLRSKPNQIPLESEKQISPLRSNRVLAARCCRASRPSTDHATKERREQLDFGVQLHRASSHLPLATVPCLPGSRCWIPARAQAHLSPRTSYVQCRKPRSAYQLC